MFWYDGSIDELKFVLFKHVFTLQMHVHVKQLLFYYMLDLY